jgi:putative toxin-antitoxin system antitoxin component (TIGR02293 family)
MPRNWKAVWPIRASRIWWRAVEVLGSRPRALAWLRTPFTGLTGLTPLQAMAGAEGRQEVEDVLGRVEHGAFG